MKEKIFLDSNLFEFFSKTGGEFSDIFKKIFSENLTTDVKSLQEIVYRYHLSGATETGYKNAMLLRKKMEILPITKKDLNTQERLLERYPNVKPRELLHTAVMINNNINKIICSPESNYSEVEELNVENIEKIF